MGKLTIQEIAKILVEKSGLNQKEANKFATEMFAIIQQRLEEDELVKIKGFGTFKIISVEARESVSVRTGERVMIDSHAKVTFTPDTVMKELVNKPFSQFETVVLNDGVDFDDVAEDEEEENVKSEEVATPIEKQPEIVEEPKVEEAPMITLAEEEPVLEDSVAEETIKVEPVVEEPVIDEPVIEEPIVEEPTVAEPVIEESVVDESLTEDVVIEEEPTESMWLKWLLSGVVVLLLMLLSAYGGYQYAMHKMDKTPTETPKETIPQVKPVDSVAVAKDTLATESPVIPDVKSEEPVKKEEPAKQEVKEPTEEVDPYAAKDERVRLGAYRIVGTAKEVTVLPGQTFYSICRAHLGPDMQCYVEVYNNLPRDPKIKKGQVIKIPKLKFKKKRKG